MPSTHGSTGVGSRITRWCPGQWMIAEETTNRNRAAVPKEHLVLYQFSARGHDMAQCILASRIDHAHDAASAYYRVSSPALGARAHHRGRIRQPVRQVGRVQRWARHRRRLQPARRRTGPIVLPMSGDVGSQYTPAAGWAQPSRTTVTCSRIAVARRHRRGARR
jgi:2-oxoisovalerate dehydrogenase E1 component